MNKSQTRISTAAGRRVFSSNHSAFICATLLCLLLALGARASTVTKKTLAPGTRFATEVFICDSGKPGPVIMITAGVHGNEPAGTLAAESIRQFELLRGTLVIVPRANVPALDANKRLIPGLNTNLSNLNRNFARANTNEPPRGELAEAIWSLAQKYKPTWLVDLHEGYDFNQLNEKSVGSSVIAATDVESRAAADIMLAAVNQTITDEKLKFTRRGPPIDGSLARAASEHLHIPSMILETTSKQPMDKRVGQHLVMVQALLGHLGMVGAANAESISVKTSPVKAAPIRVALYKGPGTGGAGPTNLLARLGNQPETSITQVTPEEIKTGILTNFDVAIFAGGSGSKQAEALGEDGRAQILQFVSKGGGYVGICAGAYLATSGYSWSLALVNARTVSPKWQRGRGSVKLELTEHGRDILGGETGQFDCIYHNGPIVKADTKADLPPIEPLAHFRTELAENGSPVGVMIDSPAIFAAPFNQGHVICVSPHPEQTPGLEEFIPHAVQWVAPTKTNQPKHSTPDAE